MSVDNHRHCQATVLGATGSGQGNGQTWHTISDLTAPNLDAIQSNWKSSFLVNKNITDDLADILALINQVAGQIQPPTEIYEGDLISTVGTTISVKNDIENGYSGPIGLTGSGNGRKLVKQEFSATTTGDGNQIATITFGGQAYPIKESAHQAIPNFSVQTTGTGNQIATITFGGQTYPIKESAQQTIPNFSVQTTGTGDQIAAITFGEQTYPIKESAKQPAPNLTIVDHGDSDGDLLAEIAYGDQNFEIHAKESSEGGSGTGIQAFDELWKRSGTPSSGTLTLSGSRANYTGLVFVFKSGDKYSTIFKTNNEIDLALTSSGKLVLDKLLSGIVPVVGNGKGLGLTDNLGNAGSLINGVTGAGLYGSATFNNVGTTGVSAWGNHSSNTTIGVPKFDQSGDDPSNSGIVADLSSATGIELTAITNTSVTLSDVTTIDSIYGLTLVGESGIGGNGSGGVIDGEINKDDHGDPCTANFGVNDGVANVSYKNKTWYKYTYTTKTDCLLYASFVIDGSTAYDEILVTINGTEMDAYCDTQAGVNVAIEADKQLTIPVKKDTEVCFYYSTKPTRIRANADTGSTILKGYNSVIRLIEFKLHATSQCVSYVVESGKFSSADGTTHATTSENDSWYRLYSDGWCEQGGLITYAQSDQTTGYRMVKLHNAYSDLSYNISYTLVNTGMTVNYKVCKTNSSGADSTEYIKFSTFVSGNKVNWKAEGYIS